MNKTNGEKAFERALKKGKVRESDRTGYLRGWNGAGRIIAKHKAAARKKAVDRTLTVSDTEGVNT